MAAAPRALSSRWSIRPAWIAPVVRLARQNPATAIAVAVLAAWVLIALTIPLWSPADPLAQDMSNRLAPPSRGHLFGTDLLGRDLLTRVLYGARASLPTGALVIGVALFVGGAYGMVSGYVGGAVDDVMMRLADITLAFPSILLALAIAAALGPSLTHAMIAMAIVWWPEFARVMRGQVLAVKEYPHVEAAQVLGASNLRIVVRHVLPETISPLIVKATLDFGNVLLLAAGLSFLGLGAVPPTPEWGAMVSDSRAALGSWWIGSFPALAILSVVLSANFLGDAIRDLADPRSRK